MSKTKVFVILVCTGCDFRTEINRRYPGYVETTYRCGHPDSRQSYIGLTDETPPWCVIIEDKYVKAKNENN